MCHSVGPVWYNGTRNEPKLLGLSVYNSLKKAEELGLKSISIPGTVTCCVSVKVLNCISAISSGIFGFPKEYCAQIMVTMMVANILILF
jgi:O-acetyl-ADP-ribose deacetylase (regulator of RNase III)